MIEFNRMRAEIIIPILSMKRQVTNWKRRLSKEYRKGCTDSTSEVIDGSFNCLTEVLAVEDLAFHIASYLIPKRNPSSLQEMMNNLIFVSRHWNRCFSLVKAQLRYDYLIKSIDSHSQWLYHKIVYVPGPSRDPRPLPAEGCLKIFCSNIKGACKEAMYEYRSNRRNDEHIDQRIDSRPDYYYKAHQENPSCLELVLPRALSWTNGSQFNLVNEIQYDQKPRLISQYFAIIDDVNGIEPPRGEDISKEGRLDLGYHEIVSVRDSENASLDPRPPLNHLGQNTTEFLKAYNAKAVDAPRWVRFAHIVGEDVCRMFIHKTLLPMIGPRPTGNSFR